LEEYAKGDTDYKTLVSTTISLARRAKTLFESSEPAEKRMILNFLLQNPTVSGKKLDFTLRKPFNAVLSLSNQPIGLRCQSRTLPLQGQYTFWIFFSQKLKKMLKSFSSPGRKCPTLPRLGLVTQKSPKGDLLLTKLPLVCKFRTLNWVQIEKEMQLLGFV
jgi:hypothetical protein